MTTLGFVESTPGTRIIRNILLLILLQIVEDVIIAFAS